MKRLHLWLTVFLLIGVSEIESQEFNQSLSLDFEEHTNVKSVSSSPNGSMLASGSFDNNTVVLWDMATQQHIATLEGHTDSVESVTFSPDGLILATGSADKTVILWGVETREKIATLQHDLFVHSVSFSPDGSKLASGTGAGIVLWDMDMMTIEPIDTIAFAEQVISATFSPDGSMLACGSSINSTITLWNAATGEHIATLEGHADVVESVSFSPDGSLLASGSWDDTVRLWDVGTRQHLHTFESYDGFVAHTMNVDSVAFSPDGSILASGAWDNTVMLWDVATRQRITILKCQDPVRSVAFSFDGSLLAAGTFKGVELWNTSEWVQPLVEETPVMAGDDESLQTSLETPSLSMVSGDNQEGEPGATLPQPFVVLAYNADGTVLTGLSVTFTVVSGGGTVNPTTVITDEQGIAKSTLTLGASLGTQRVEVSAAGIPIVIGFLATSKNASPPLPGIDADVNDDGVVNVVDLAIVALNYGRQNVIHAHGDVNGDGVVDVNDLLAVAAVIDGGAAPSARDQAVEVFTAEQVAHWLKQARLVGEDSFDYRRGVQFLEGVLALLTPKETALLPNFPNPFNPETWIPYRLAEDAFVTFTIYDASGRTVRVLDVGHQPAGFYQGRSGAIYWDGRQESGEQMASGVYFFHLSAGDFAATRKMLIRK